MRIVRTSRGEDAADGRGEVRSAVAGVEPDELLAGEFDQTNGVVTGLDGESDGTIDGETTPAAFRTGAMSSARLWHPGPVAAEAPPDEDAEPVDREHEHRRLHLRR